VAESYVDDEFVEAAAITMAGIVAKGRLKRILNHKRSFQSHAHHFLAWNRICNQTNPVQD